MNCNFHDNCTIRLSILVGHCVSVESSVFRADLPINPIRPLFPYCDFLVRVKPVRMTIMVIPIAGHCPANPLAVQPGTSPKAAVKLDAH